MVLLYFSGPLGLWLVCCFDLKVGFRSRAFELDGVASVITIDEQLQLNRGCYFHHADFEPEDLKLKGARARARAQKI